MEERRLKKKHVVGISIFLFVKILLIIAVIYLSYTIVQVKYELSQQIQDSNKEIMENLIDYQTNTQAQINEIRDSLLVTRTDLLMEIGELRATSGVDFSGIIEFAIPAVVSVGTDTSQGSGFVISDDGYLITNYHVLQDARFIRVLTYDSTRWRSAQLIGYNETMDLAILKMSGEYEFLEFEDSENIRIGEKVIAIGNPLGLSFSVTEGIVSARDREGPNEIPAYFQIDTPLNPGNSGGPLINTKGKVIGINNFKLRGSENLGFALESNYVVETINQIFESKGIAKRI